MKTRKTLTILVLGIMALMPGFARAVPMGTAFTYQGHLYDANYPANGLYDFAFKLYDANVGGGKVGTDVNIGEVDVVDAYFSVELNFGNVFDGNARWLEIGIRPGDMNDPNSYTTLSPRQEVTPTPYALHTFGIADGPVVHLNFNEGSGSIAHDSSGHGNDCTLQAGITSEDWVDGKFGGAINPDGASDEYGECPSSISFDDELTFSAWINADLLGQRAIISKMSWNSSSMKWHGAFLLIRNDDTVGFILADGTTQIELGSPTVLTTGQWYHVAGTYDGSRGALYVDGELVASVTTSVFDDPGAWYPLSLNRWPGWHEGRFDGTMDEVRVYKRALSSEEIAKLASHGGHFNGQVKITGGSPGAGKVLTSDASGLGSWQAPADSDWTISGSDMYSAVSGNVGIGTTSPGVKLEINGDAHVDGSLTWQTKTSYVSIPAAAFGPASNHYEFINVGSYLVNMDDNSDTYTAGVQLPHGATVTKMTFYWRDDSTSDGYVELARAEDSMAIEILAVVYTSGNSGFGNSSETTISHATIDNSQYTYILYLNLPDSDVYCLHVVIEYTFTEPY
jgi:hypothetical protein